MTDHVTITDTQIEPDAPVTATLMGQLRDNPIAMAEGSQGATNISGAAFGTSFWLGFFKRTAALYSTITVDMTNVRWVKTQHITVATVDAISLSSNGGSTWGADQTISDPAYIDLQTGNVIQSDGTALTSVFTPLSGCNAIRLRNTSNAYTVDVYAVQGRTSW